MILSMTGFGRGRAACRGRIFTFELKTLNSKQLDLILRLPTRYRQLEGELRNLIAKNAERGKIEGVFSVELTGDDPSSSFNTELLKRYKEQIIRLDDELGIGHPSDWQSVLLRLPDVLKSEDADLSDEEIAAANEAVEDSLKNMRDFRLHEGRKLFEFFTERIAAIRSLLEEIQEHEGARVAKIKARLLDNLEKLSGVEVDQGRLEQEMIFYIEKLDITEEKQRLAAHLDYFIQTMGPSDEEIPGSKGKKLGFIAQEMGREINTMGSKSNNAEMQIIVVKMKDELEQIKEQVLNVL